MGREEGREGRREEGKKGGRVLWVVVSLLERGRAQHRSSRPLLPVHVYTRRGEVTSKLGGRRRSLFGLRREGAVGRAALGRAYEVRLTLVLWSQYLPTFSILAKSPKPATQLLRRQCI